MKVPHTWCGQGATCPGPDCRGQFMWLRNYGVVCSQWLQERSEEEWRVLRERARDNHPMRTLVGREGVGL